MEKQLTGVFELTSRAFAVLPYFTVLGCAGLVLTATFGFEEPDKRWLVCSGLLLAAAPVGLGLHLALARDLTATDKRLWLAGLLTFREPGLFAEYFAPASRYDATQRLHAKAAGRGRE